MDTGPKSTDHEEIGHSLYITSRQFSTVTHQCLRIGFDYF